MKDEVLRKEMEKNYKNSISVSFNAFGMLMSHLNANILDDSQSQSMNTSPVLEEIREGSNGSELSDDSHSSSIIESPSESSSLDEIM